MHRLVFFPPLTALALITNASVQAEPLLTSWQTQISTKYARIYTSATNRTNGVSATTWTGQTSPTYCGVHEIDYSASWVYLKNTGLGAHIMGPWNNPNLPKNQGASGLTPVYRFPRTPAAIPTTKTHTAGGAIGFLVDGIAIFNMSDGFSYSVSHAEDASPVAGIGQGDGVWNRDAYPNEAVSFDYAFSHNPQSGQYHSHVDPIATRYLMGDNVTYNSGTKQYAENTATTTFLHSPILGWLADGLPVYGPYGYDGGSIGATATANISGGSVTSVNIISGGSLYQSVPLIAFTGGGGTGAAGTAVISGGVVMGVTMTSGGSGYTSAPVVTIGGVRRMVSGYQLRDGTNGTTNLNSTGRTTLPGWAAFAQGKTGTLSGTPYTLTSGQYGPSTTYVTGTAPNQTTYTLGHYWEDYDYLGNLGYTQGSRTNSGGIFFDLNMYNARYCVTPEFPNGTWAYFVTIQADGTPVYPYIGSRWYYGSPTGGTVSSITETVTQYFKGAASTTETWNANAPISEGSSNVTLTWNEVEGGNYQVSASSDLTNWTTLSLTVTPSISLAPTVGSIISSATTTETGGGLNTRRFYKVTRLSLATYDSTGY
ncbi:YHYH protein [Chthoniobacter flavus]|nr:YHYH protein [Chthoniobacter flavus]